MNAQHVLGLVLAMQAFAIVFPLALLVFAMVTPGGHE